MEQQTALICRYRRMCLVEKFRHKNSRTKSNVECRKRSRQGKYFDDDDDDDDDYVSSEGEVIG